MDDLILFLLVMVKQNTKRYKYIDSMYLDPLILSVCLRKHSQTSPKKDFYTIITTAPSPFIFIVNIKGTRQGIRAHFDSRGEAISTVSQQESKTAFIL